ncbi:hypothetical protein EUGRSUZ_K00424 [Eucalyptus grandis]|uniref:Uncharacterized protein n=2 Tax=Eucalyptus grandis TaxID=71139 RepID=A0ACC3IQ79_EUCGR|nr:hypothetical protein EUGRSUZ_K00424 [Eucalyptus grandis]
MLLSHSMFMKKLLCLSLLNHHQKITRLFEDHLFKIYLVLTTYGGQSRNHVFATHDSVSFLAAEKHFKLTDMDTK